MKNSLTLFLIFGFACCAAQNRYDVDSLKTRYENQPADSLKFATLNHIVNYYMYRDAEKAYDYIQEELRLAKEIDLSSGEALAYYQMGIILNNKDQLDSARYYYNKSLKMGKELNNPIYISQAHRGLAILEFSQGNLPAADSINDQDLEYTTRFKDSTGMALALDFKGTINQNRGYYSIALENVLKGLTLFEAIGDSIRIGDSYNHLATLEYNMENYRKAIEYNQKALDIYEIYEDTYYQAQALIDIGVMYKQLKEYEKALDYFSRSIEKCRQAGVRSLEGSAYNNIGAIYLEQGRVNEAVENLNTSIEIFKEINAQRRIAIAQNRLSEAFMDQGENQKALSLLKENQDYARKTENISILSRTLELKSRAENLRGNRVQALTDYQEFKKLSDSLLNKEKVKTIEEFRIRFQTEKQEAALAVQEEKIKTLNEKSRADRLSKSLFGGAAVFFIALSGALYFGFTQRMRKNKAEREKQEELYLKEIEHKKKELASQTLHLVQKNTFIQELMENLQSIKNDPEKFKVEFRRMVMLLKKENASDKDWEVFKTYFAEVHNDFDQKLRTLYHDISEKEIRLAAFLRMNLTTKEIAATLNVLPDSILKSKYRLKKKLGLDKETELSSFLNSI